jgi:enamine deaminase RidA (YjgF/YER057c/UK114 family)
MAEKKVIEIEIKDNSKSLKAQYKEAVLEVQKLADAFGATSIEVQNASKKAAELKDQIEDVNDAIQAQKGEGAFIALGKSVSAVANGFSAVQGAMGLVGVESEEVQQAMLRVQSAMALAQGLEGLEDAGRAFKQLGAVVKSTTIFTSAYNFVMGISNKETLANVAITEADSVAKVGLGATTVGVTTATTGATTAMKLFRLALIATGIGAIIVLVGLLIANFDKVTKVVTTLSGYVIKAYDYFDNLGTGIKVLVGIFFPFIGVVYGAIKALEYFNVIDTKNERNMQARHEANMKRVDKSLAKQEQQRKARKKAYDEETGSIDRQIKLLEAQGKSTVALEQLQLKRSLTNQRELIKEARLNLQILRATNMLGVNDEMIEETLKSIAEMKQGILNTETDIKVARINNAKETKKEIDKIEKTDSIDLTKDPKYIAEQQRLAELNKLELDAIEKSEKAIKDANALKLQQEQEFQSQMEEIDEDNFQKGLQKTMTEEEYQLELVRQKYFTLEELAKGNAEQLAIIETAKALEIEEIDKKSKEKQIANENELRQKRLQLAGQAFTAIGDIIGAFTAKNDKDARKQFQIQKAFNLAAAVTNTAMAVTGALTAGGNPIKLATGMQFVEAGIAAATGAVNIAKIASAKFGGGGGGGDTGAPPAIGGVVAPNLNVVGDTGINQLATLQQQPVKAYVVSNDVTSAQQFDMKVQQTAQI